MTNFPDLAFIGFFKSDFQYEHRRGNPATLSNLTYLSAKRKRKLERIKIRETHAIGSIANKRVFYLRRMVKPQVGYKGFAKQKPRSKA
jgi:hypothetical protein